MSFTHAKKLFVYRATDCKKRIVLATAHIDKFPETIALAGIDHKVSEKIMKLFEKPTKSFSMKKGEDWEEIVMQIIREIDGKAK